MICQQNRDQSPSSTTHGRTSVKEAAHIHNDCVKERLDGLNSDQFVCHMSNACY